MTDEPLRLLSPKNDFVFKQLFGDAENIEPLAAFLQAALDLPQEEFAELAIVDPNLNAEFSGDKHCILDVRVKTRSGRNIDVEIQVKFTPELFNRIQCYTAKMVAGQVRAGETYRNMAQSIAIVITDFPLWEELPTYHHRFRLYEPGEQIEYPNSMRIHILELRKLPEQSDGTKLWDWMKFMSSETKDEFASLAGKDSVMANVIGRLLELSADEAAQLRADARMKAEWDEWGRIKMSREEGLVEGMTKGLEKGVAKGQQKTALRLIRMGMTADFIADATGLTKTEIEQLAQTEKVFS